MSECLVVGTMDADAVVTLLAPDFNVADGLPIA